MTTLSWLGNQIGTAHPGQQGRLAFVHSSYFALATSVS